MKRSLILWVPFAVFVGVAILVASALFAPADRTVKSKLIGQPLPEFALDPMIVGKPGLSTQAFATGRPRLLNIFASWCVPCIAEAPHLMALKDAGATIDAIAIRDEPDAVAAFLARHGDPYRAIGDDAERRVQLNLGSSGVPETFVIDGRGRIVMQHIGDIRAEDVPEILAALEAAE